MTVRGSGTAEAQQQGARSRRREGWYLFCEVLGEVKGCGSSDVLPSIPVDLLEELRIVDRLVVALLQVLVGLHKRGSKTLEGEEKWRRAARREEQRERDLMRWETSPRENGRER
eukprot:764548-Hanusia_phi.AAC.1